MLKLGTPQKNLKKIMTEDKIPFLASYLKNIYLWKKSPQNFTNVNLFKNQIDYLKKLKFIKQAPTNAVEHFQLCFFPGQSSLFSRPNLSSKSFTPSTTDGNDPTRLQRQ